MVLDPVKQMHTDSVSSRIMSCYFIYHREPKTLGTFLQFIPLFLATALFLLTVTIIISSVPDPVPSIFGPPGSECVSERYGSGSVSQKYGSGSFHHQAKIVRKTFLRNTDYNAGSCAAEHCCEEGGERCGPHGAAHIMSCILFLTASQKSLGTFLQFSPVLGSALFLLKVIIIYLGIGIRML
jgi:hypothetical protein